jgi:hypothetical protein
MGANRAIATGSVTIYGIAVLKKQQPTLCENAPTARKQGPILCEDAGFCESAPLSVRPSEIFGRFRENLSGYFTNRSLCKPKMDIAPEHSLLRRKCTRYARLQEEEMCIDIVPEQPILRRKSTRYARLQEEEEEEMCIDVVPEQPILRRNCTRYARLQEEEMCIEIAPEQPILRRKSTRYARLEEEEMCVDSVPEQPILRRNCSMYARLEEEEMRSRGEICSCMQNYSIEGTHTDTKKVKDLATHPPATTALLLGIASHKASESDCLISALHFYPFGGFGSTVRWASQI